MAQQFSERFAQRENLSQITGGEIRAGGCGVSSFATDLNHADNFPVGQNRRTNYFLNGFGGFAATVRKGCRFTSAGNAASLGNG